MTETLTFQVHIPDAVMEAYREAARLYIGPPEGLEDYLRSLIEVIFQDGRMVVAWKEQQCSTSIFYT